MTTKYRAKRTTRQLPDGSILKFDSLAEAAYYDSMKYQQLAYVSHPEVGFDLDGAMYWPDGGVPSPIPPLGYQGFMYFVEIKGGRMGKTPKTGKPKLFTNATPQWRQKMRQFKIKFPDVRLKIVYGRADKNRIFVTEKEEWL